ncbi:conjugal transfer protein TraD [Sphingomonas sp. AR_OL41]|uniref:conjugal transfer protein TraD n=1 Tax=Sphingomonas sp. AR_OL41 TaxID=3042729 RepID=UPI00248156FE|nr:conjugal transfer protein TraD [Sphingomonas sp. AR_OL41]MDH7975432.1 conjugal transfer protein TraD [Sphingomonas sp. AR_OL41]
MRKPRDYDAELKALTDRAKQLKERKVHQLGELVIATGADNLTIEQLAGLLLSGTESKDASAKEDWRKRGAAFFQRQQGNAGDGSQGNIKGAAPNDRGTPPAGSQPRQN